MKLSGCGGSAAVELAAIAPIAALLIAVAFQLSFVMDAAVSDVAEAGAAASAAVRDWDHGAAGRGFRRPCLELMPELSFFSRPRALPLGVGPFKFNVEVPQEVRVVGSPICIP